MSKPVKERPVLGKGIRQRRVGDEFEMTVCADILQKPSALGADLKATLLALRTEGSRGEVDILSLSSDGTDGKVVLSMIQAKRNGYLPQEDREKLAALLDGIGDSKDVRLFLAHYTDKTRWKLTRLRKAEDFLKPVRVRAWDDDQLDSELADTEDKGRDRKDEDFEMAVVNAFKAEFNNIVAKMNPEFEGFVPFFVIRLEEGPGEPNIMALARRGDEVKLFLVYTRRDAYIPPHEVAAVEMFHSLAGTNEFIEIGVAYYVHGKTWRYQNVAVKDELAQFYFL